MFYDLDGSLVETQAIDGGVQSCLVMALKVVVLSGMGEVVLVQRERDSVNLSSKLGWMMWSMLRFTENACTSPSNVVRS